MKKLPQKWTPRVHRMILEKVKQTSGDIRYDWVFKRMRGHAGYFDPDKFLVKINQYHDVIATIIHESLHILYPEAPETKIKKLERAIAWRLSPLEAENILDIFLEAIKRTRAHSTKGLF